MTWQKQNVQEKKNAHSADSSGSILYGMIKHSTYR